MYHKTPIKSIRMMRRKNINGNIHTFVGLNKDDGSSRPLRKIATFDDHDHMSVLCQHHSSIWPFVLPYCITNTIFTISVWIWNDRDIDRDFSIDPNGHKYMAALLSFLVIARVTMIYNRYMLARTVLEQLLQSGQELVQLALVMTKSVNTRYAKLWRQEVAFRTIDMVRDTIVGLGYESSLPVLPHQRSRQEMMWSEYYRRAPFMKAWILRKIILKPREAHEMHREMFGEGADTELKLLAFTGDYLNAFNKLDGLLQTSFPFPLIQMARTILFVWIFTLPFSLVHESYPLWGITLLIFLLTYGFLGLEFVSIQMHDPFGQDDLDFNQEHLAKMLFEDVYVAIFGVDGEGAAVELRNRVEASKFGDLFNDEYHV